ncbi:PQQ-binding-like beta-propeller repeat protein [Streptomyces sp. NPDC102406]|uniref:outer membrane protein assembly factor BamB family protein n=1 Tax=Streptomyces sp. NPDC102406 TaxID=3366171 RepID=UPI0038255D3C
MTQPPPPPQQPPNEPPQDPLRKQQPDSPAAPQPPAAPPAGGFGAPTTPPPGGFGAPTPPAPSQDAPGYGYPQAPPPPPQGAPGYGYPGQQPHQPPPPAYGQPQQPYGQPQFGQQPYGQPQYGYPQPPTAAMTAPGGGGGKKPSPIVWIITAAVVVIALIVGGGILYAGSSDDGKDDKKTSADGKDGDQGKDGSGPAGGEEKVPGSTAASIAFQLPAPKVAKDAVWSVAGSWLTDSTYAKAELNQLIGYEPDSGTKKWTLPLTGQTCGASPEVTEAGLAAVLSEDGKRKKDKDYFKCTEITVFDVNTGKKVWSDSVEVSGQKIAFKELSVSGTTLAVGGGYDGGAAFDITSGKSLWKPQQGSCEDVGYRGGEQLVAVRKCGDFDAETYEIQVLDPATGKPRSTYKVPGAPGSVNLLSVFSSKPVTFGVALGEEVKYTDAFALDDTGNKLRAKITIDPEKYDVDCEVGEVHGCKGVVVGNDRLYLPSQQHDGSGTDQVNEIVSYSLADGKITGDRFDSGADYEIFPLRMDGGNVLAYKDGPYDKGAQVVTIDPEAGKQTVLLETPATQSVRNVLSRMVPKSSEMLYSNGRLFMGKDLISEPYSADDKQYAAIGFTAK